MKQKHGYLIYSSFIDKASKGNVKNWPLPYFKLLEN